jgi:type IV secretion system protein VirB5
MSKHTLKVVSLIACLVVLPGRVLASGIPTVDIANILQTTTTAFENIEQTASMIEQLDNMVKQYEQQIKHLESMTGTRGMGGLLTAVHKAKDRRWAPEDINQALATIRAGGIPGTNQSYRVAIERIKNSTGSMSSDELDMGDNGYLANSGGSYDETRASNLAAIGLSENSYSDTNKRTDHIESLMGQIDAAPDQKAALDLMNTLVAQMLVLQNESIRLQAAILQNQASTNLNQANAEAAEAQFHNRGNLP